MVSLFGQIFLALAFQLGMWFWLRAQSWFVPHKPDSNEIVIDCAETTSMYDVSMFQYIGIVYPLVYLIHLTCSVYLFEAVCVAFSVGAPYRKPMWTNGFPLVLFFYILLL